MTQSTLDGGIVEVKTLEIRLPPTERLILNCVRHHPGLTHKQIRDWMRGSKIEVFDNKLRALRQKGFVESHYDRAMDALLWYPTLKKEAVI